VVEDGDLAPPIRLGRSEARQKEGLMGVLAMLELRARRLN